MIKIKKIKPMFTSIITTMDVYEEDVYTAGGILDTSKQRGNIKELQTVISVGASVRDIKEGDLVCVNPSRYAVKKHEEGSLKDGIIMDNPVIKYNFDVIEIDDKPCLYLQDRDIDFIVEDYEEVPDPKPSVIIQPEKPSIIFN